MAQQERLPEGLSCNFKQRKEERSLNVSQGLLHLAHLPAHLMWLLGASKTFHSCFLFFPMTIQHGFKLDSLHRLLLILYT